LPEPYLCKEWLRRSVPTHSIPLCPCDFGHKDTRQEMGDNLSCVNNNCILTSYNNNNNNNNNNSNNNNNNKNNIYRGYHQVNAKLLHFFLCNFLLPLWLYLKGAQSRYFGLFWPHTKLPLNGRKPENNSLIRQKNTKEIMINHTGTRMAKDGED